MTVDVDQIELRQIQAVRRNSDKLILKVDLAMCVSGWASNGITMRLLSTEYRMLSIARGCCLEVARTV